MEDKIYYENEVFKANCSMSLPKDINDSVNIFYLFYNDDWSSFGSLACIDGSVDGLPTFHGLTLVTSCNDSLPANVRGKSSITYSIEGPATKILNGYSVYCLGLHPAKNGKLVVSRYYTFKIHGMWSSDM